MPYAGLFSFVTALKIGARLWRDVLARKPEKPCKYCEFATFHYSFWSVLSPLLRRMNPVSTAGWDRKKGRLFGSNHGSFSNVPELCLRIEKSAPRRIMRSAPKYREIGFQETAGFGKEIFPETFLGTLHSDLGTDLGPLHVYLFGISQSSRFARKQGGSLWRRKAIR